MRHFNIRVYGVWINENSEVLVSDERRHHFTFTKFPGGGLEFGEGIKDCLVREWKEEVNLDIEIIKHIYTTDFFQISAFDENAQIISIYYFIKPLQNKAIEVKQRLNDFHYQGIEEQCLRWIPLVNFTEKELTLPIDKFVVKLILSDFTTNKN